MRFDRSTVLLAVCLALLGLLLMAVPAATSGGTYWLGIDWVDGRKLFSIDDAYRYFAATSAFTIGSVFLWNYTLPLALGFDALLATLTDGALLPMRGAHAVIGLATLVVVARAGIRAGCGNYLALASVVILGTMPVYLILSSSFYAEGLAAFVVALAFYFLITEKPTALAVAAGLLPLIRPEGSIYAALLLVWFAMRRDAVSCAILVLPGLAYFGCLALFSDDGMSIFTWRLELRKILAPLDEGVHEAVSPGRLPNLLWVALAGSSLFIPRWRRWWPVLLGPWILYAIQLVAIGRGVQGFELRYLFTSFPVLAIAWAFPIRSLLDRHHSSIRSRRLTVGLATLTMVFAVSSHAFQSDWIRAALPGKPPRADTPTRRPAGDIGSRNPAFDTTPLRAFAARTDALIAGHDGIDTVFVSHWAPLYFTDFLDVRPDVEVVLIPHNATVAAYSGGYFFGFSLPKLAYRYYRFEPGTPADSAAVLIVNESGQDPFNFAPSDERAPAPDRRERAPVAASVQSGTFKTYAVKFTARETVSWDIDESRQLDR